jgi:hypothetical protein
MPLDANNSPDTWSQRSTFDRRAIHVAGSLLLAGIWLERQVKHAPMVVGGRRKLPRFSHDPRPLRSRSISGDPATGSPRAWRAGKELSAGKERFASLGPVD